MPNTFTAHYSFTMPEVGQDADAWGGHLNEDLVAIDNELWNRVRSDVPQTLTKHLILNGQNGQIPGAAATDAFVLDQIQQYDPFIKRYMDNRIAWFMDNYVLPIGTVIMWSGTIASIPWGWALCNGAVYNQQTTPNLNDRFILQTGSYAPGTAGGTPLNILAYHTHEPASGVSSGPAGNPVFYAYNVPVDIRPPFYVMCYIMRVVRMQDGWPA